MFTRLLILTAFVAMALTSPVSFYFNGHTYDVPDSYEKIMHRPTSENTPMPAVSMPVRPLLREMDGGDFVLGFFNPDTVYTITSDTVLYSNIIMVNNARLEIRDARVQYRGDILLTGNSRMIVENARFDWFQDYDYQYHIHVFDSSEFRMESSTLNTGGFPLGMGGASRSRFGMDNIEMERAFITFGAYQSCSLGVSNTVFPGEFVMVEGEARTDLVNVDTCLVWFGFPKHSGGSLSVTDEDAVYIESMHFPDDDVYGIDYTLSMENVTNLMVGAMIYDSTDVLLYNTDFRVIGMIFDSTVTDTLTGFSNGLDIPLFEPDISGRSMRLEDCRVNTWNFYGFGRSNIMLDGIVFGEYLTGGEGRGEIFGSLCDGSGGHLGADATSQLLMFMSSSTTLAILENNSTSFFVESSFIMRGGLILRNSALAVAVHTYMANPPVLEDSSALFIVDIYIPTVVREGDVVDIEGTAMLLTGPESLLAFEGYRLRAAPSDSPGAGEWITEYEAEQVEDDVLASWDTDGMETGDYFLTMWIYFSYAGILDSTYFDYYVYIGENESINEALNIDNKNYVYSMPFYSGLCIYAPDNALVTIHDTQGRRVADLGRGRIWNADDPGGVYILRARLGDSVVDGKAVLLR